jgi:hypothetical protein
LQVIFICRKILRLRAFGSIYHPKEGVLLIFIILTNPSPRPGFNRQHLSQFASTLTTRPPRRLPQMITNVYEEHISPSSTSVSTLKMEVICSSNMLVNNFKTTLRAKCVTIHIALCRTKYQL